MTEDIQPKEPISRNEIPLFSETPTPEDLDRYFGKFIDKRNDPKVKNSPELAEKAQKQHEEAMLLEEELKNLKLASVPVDKAREVSQILRRLTDQPLASSPEHLIDDWDVYTEIPGSDFIFSVEYGSKPYKKGNPPERAGFFNRQEKKSQVSGSGRFFNPDEFAKLTETIEEIGAQVVTQK